MMNATESSETANAQHQDGTTIIFNNNFLSGICDFHFILSSVMDVTIKDTCI